MRKQTVNLWAVAVCIVMGQIVSTAWHMAFSESWSALNGFAPEQAKVQTGMAPYLASIIASSLMAYTMAWIFTKIPVKSLFSGFLTGLLFGLVFIFFQTVVMDMFSGRSVMLSLINGGGAVVVYAITGSILGAWRNYD